MTRQKERLSTLLSEFREKHSKAVRHYETIPVSYRWQCQDPVITPFEQVVTPLLARIEELELELESVQNELTRTLGSLDLAEDREW